MQQNNPNFFKLRSAMPLRSQFTSVKIRNKTTKPLLYYITFKASFLSRCRASIANGMYTMMKARTVVQTATFSISFWPRLSKTVAKLIVLTGVTNPAPKPPSKLLWNLTCSGVADSTYLNDRDYILMHIQPSFRKASNRHIFTMVDRSPRNLVRWRILTLRTEPAVKISNSKQFTMADGCYFEK